jgi:hypothetical protein
MASFVVGRLGYTTRSANELPGIKRLISTGAPPSLPGYTALDCMLIFPTGRRLPFRQSYGEGVERAGRERDPVCGREVCCEDGHILGETDEKRWRKMCAYQKPRRAISSYRPTSDISRWWMGGGKQGLKPGHAFRQTDRERERRRRESGT